MPHKWITWCRLRNGGDARRPSGVGYTRTTRSHIERPDDSNRTLCGLEVQLLKHAATDEPQCKMCLARAKKAADGDV